MKSVFKFSKEYNTLGYIHFVCSPFFLIVQLLIFTEFSQDSGVEEWIFTVINIFIDDVLQIFQSWEEWGIIICPRPNSHLRFECL